MDLEQALQIVKAAGYRVSKPRVKAVANGLNAIGKPYSASYNPNYKMKHVVTPIRRLLAPMRNTDGGRRMIIKLRDGAFIKTENITKEGVWGWRWNKNTQRFADQCVFYSFWDEINESDLPKALPRLEIDE